MDIKVYSLPNCSSCAHLKELINRINIDDKVITEISIGNDITIEQFKEENPSIERLPHVIIDGVEIGGLVEVAKKLLEEGLVSAPQK